MMNRTNVPAVLTAAIARLTKEGTALEATVASKRSTIEALRAKRDDASRRLDSFTNDFQRAVENGQTAPLGKKGSGGATADLGRKRVAIELVNATVAFDKFLDANVGPINEAAVRIEKIEAEIDRLIAGENRRNDVVATTATFESLGFSASRAAKIAAAPIKKPAPKPVAAPVLTVVSTPVEPPKPQLNVVALFDKWGGVGANRKQTAERLAGK